MNESKRMVVRRSRREWQGILSRFEASGLTHKQFCASEDLAPSTFALWRRRLGGPAEPGVRRAAGDGAVFVELADPPTAVPLWDAELDFGGGVVLRVRRVRSC